MRKRLMAMMLMVVTVLAFSVPSVMAKQEVSVKLNGATMKFTDAKPCIDENNRVLIPLRFVSEKLGATVDYKNKKITITKNGSVVELTIGSKKVKVNGTVKTLDTAAVLKGNSTLVPTRFVSEALGASVDYKKGVVTINSKDVTTATTTAQAVTTTTQAVKVEVKDTKKAQ